MNLRVLVQHESLGDDLDHHLARVDGQKNVLGLLDRLGHGEENAIEQNGRHHHIVEVLIGGNVDAHAPCLVPWLEQEQAVRAGEAVDVVLLEALRDDAEGLEEKQ